MTTSPTIPRPFYFTTKILLADFVAILLHQAAYWSGEELAR
jgi:hypothetical protein